MVKHERKAVSHQDTEAVEKEPTVRAAEAAPEEGAHPPVGDAPKAPGRDENFKADIPADIDDEAQYEVTLWRSVEFAGGTLRPDQKVWLKGAVVTQLKDSILAAAKAS